jgi:hypothetical protein
MAAVEQLRVTVETYCRSKEGEPYALQTKQEGILIDDLSVGIGWWFPGGDTSLDRIVIDGKVFADDKLDAKGKDTAVKEGSLVQGYKTHLPDDPDDDDA